MESNGWITDRLPRLDDTEDDMVWVWVRYKSSEYAALRDYTDVSLGTPWQPIIEPPPYVNPLRLSSRWKPKQGEPYWFYLNNGVQIKYWRNNLLDEIFYESDNVFQTQKEAMEEFKKFEKLSKQHHDGR